MIRHFLFMTAALALTVAACSDDDDDSSTQTSTNANQPSAGAGGGAMAAAGSGGGATTSAGAGGGAATGAAGDSSMPGAAGSSAMPGAAGSAGLPQTEGGDNEMSFFVTSEGSGELGGNLGGLEGADAICQRLAEAVGSNRTWRAYLSTDTVDARDRIGDGPWFNQAGALIANDVEELHDENTVFNGNPNLILDENGVVAPVNEHDILTGTLADGTRAEGLNCNNWTSNDETLTQNPQVGHSDIPADPMFSPSWNSAHVSANCSQAGLTQRGGAGRLYCFAE